MSGTINPDRKAGTAANAIVALLALVALLMAVSPHAAHAAPPADAAAGYRLGPLDKLKIRISEWQTDQAAFRDWSSVSGDYTVGADGTISLPFAGSLQAAGKTTSELAGEIGKRLQQDLGLIDQPSAAVEIGQYRPVFLTGDVETPGQYPYQPGLTVLKAVSLAGGLRHDSNSSDADRNFLNARGDYDVLVAKRNQLLAIKARLEAEADGKSEAKMPPELKGKSNAEQLMTNQNDILGVNNRTNELRLSALKNLKELLHSEITSLGEKGDTQQKQLTLLQKQLEGVDKLAGKGLVVNSRVLNLQAQIADLQSRLLDIDTATLQARQDINKADQDQITFDNTRNSDRADQLQDTNEQLRETEHKLATNRDLMLEAVMRSATMASGDASEPQVNYSIVRVEKDGSTKTIKADEATPVRPGDVIKTDAVATLFGNG